MEAVSAAKPLMLESHRGLKRLLKSPNSRSLAD
jgi:hypothetical protein